MRNIVEPYQGIIKYINNNKEAYMAARNETEIENAIQEKGLNAPRLTPAKIDAVIKGKTFTKLPSGKTMICELTLTSGFTVRGESSVVSPENFDQEIGEEISYEDARNKIWPLEAYLLQQEYPV